MFFGIFFSKVCICARSLYIIANNSLSLSFGANNFDKFYIFNCGMVNWKKENFIPIKYSEGFLFFCFLFFSPTLEKSHGNESDVSK